MTLNSITNEIHVSCEPLESITCETIVSCEPLDHITHVIHIPLKSITCDIHVSCEPLETLLHVRHMSWPDNDSSQMSHHLATSQGLMWGDPCCCWPTLASVQCTHPWSWPYTCVSGVQPASPATGSNIDKLIMRELNNGNILLKSIVGSLNLIF